MLPWSKAGIEAIAESVAVAAPSLVSDLDTSVTDNLRVAISRSDSSGHLIYANQAFADLLGYPDAATVLSTATGQIFIDSERRNRWRERAEADGFVHGAEEQVRHFSGRTVWINSNGRAVRDQHGAIVYFERAVVDVTTTRRAVDALVETQRRFESFFERSPVAYLIEDFSALNAWFELLRDRGVTDLADYLASHPEEVQFGADLIRIVDVNPAAVSLLGASSAEDLIEMSVGSWLSTAELSTFRDQMIAVWNGESSFQAPGTGKMLDGRELHYILTWVVTEGGGEELSKVIVSVEDVTDLTRARQRLVDLVEVKDTFIESLSHQLRTPLTAVYGFANELLERADEFSDDEHKEFMTQVACSAGQAAAILDNLRVVSYLSDSPDVLNARLRVTRQPVDLAEEVVDHLRLLCPDPDSSVRFGGGSALAAGDPRQVRQVIDNLVRNAIEHGGPTIVVRVFDGGGRASVVVEDDGPGLSGDALGRITGSTDDLDIELGVGLTVAKALTEAMDGELLHDRIGGSTLFSVELPSWNGGDPV